MPDKQKDIVIGQRDGNHKTKVIKGERYRETY